MPRVLVIGLGTIGRAVADAAATRADLQLVGLIDASPTVAGTTRHSLRVLPYLARAPDADVAMVTTGSRLRDVLPTLNECVQRGWHVVSSCEELAWPYLRFADAAATLDASARACNVAVLGTGVNPGFAMDAFALASTAACVKVDSIEVTRSLDAATRRPQLQKKCGAGMTVGAFEQAKAAGTIGHVGLAESAAMLAAGLGVKHLNPADVTENITPVLATSLLETPVVRVEPGQLRGTRIVAEIQRGRRPFVRLDLTMALAADTFDAVKITGDPPLKIRVQSGFPGEKSTVALLINAAAAITHFKPGLRTMIDAMGVRSITHQP